MQVKQALRLGAERSGKASASGGCDPVTCLAMDGCTTEAVCNAATNGVDCCKWRDGGCHQSSSCTAEVKKLDAAAAQAENATDQAVDAAEELVAQKKSDEKVL